MWPQFRATVAFESFMGTSRLSASAERLNFTSLLDPNRSAPQIAHVDKGRLRRGRLPFEWY